MPKYYVETGNLQQVVASRTPFYACVFAVRRASNHFLDTGEGGVTLGDSFIVNQKGFPSNREPFLIDSFNDTIIPTSRVIEAYENGKQ